MTRKYVVELLAAHDAKTRSGTVWDAGGANQTQPSVSRTTTWLLERRDTRWDWSTYALVAVHKTAEAIGAALFSSRRDARNGRSLAADPWRRKKRYAQAHCA